MLMVKSNATGELAECTVCQGIVGCDGVRRGAIADIDFFDCFNINLMMEVYLESGDAFFYEDTDLDLWELKEIRDRVIINRQAAAKVVEIRPSTYDANGNFVPSDRVRYLREYYENQNQADES